MKLAYDIGGFDGNDTEHYMRLGYRTICVEAAPTLAEKIKERFTREISDGRCVVLNCAVGDREGFLPFYICRENGIRNSFDRSMAEREGYHADEIQVPFRRFDSIVREYGIPEYCKVDIEGADGLVVKALTAENAPQYFSFEANPDDLGLLMHLERVGYTRFNLIRQDTWQPVYVPRPGETAHIKWSARQVARLKLRKAKRLHAVLRALKPNQEGKHEGTKAGIYKIDSSGPTPMEQKEGWRSFQELTHDWLAIVYSGLIDSVWYDVHAAK